MFNKTLTGLTLTKQVADGLFLNIKGQDYRGDVSFLATLRALMYKRVPKEESISLRVTGSNYAKRDVEAAKPKDAVRAFLRNTEIQSGVPGSLHIHSFNSAFDDDNMLIQGFETEVAWHGVVFRDEKESNRFYITDIMVYPQIVTGGTANTEQIPYQNWLYAHEDDVFNNIRMQGHSHVNYSTNPSSVDIVHQEKILSQIDDDMFYIFMIWNKKFEKTIKIYDLANNTLYETGDVEIYIGDDGCDLNAFVKASKELVKIQPMTYGYNYGKQQAGFQTQNQSGSNKGGKSKPKDGKKDKPDIGSSGRSYNYGGYYGTDDDDDQYGVYGYGDRFQR